MLRNTYLCVVYDQITRLPRKDKAYRSIVANQVKNFFFGVSCAVAVWKEKIPPYRRRAASRRLAALYDCPSFTGSKLGRCSWLWQGDDPTDAETPGLLRTKQFSSKRCIGSPTADQSTDIAAQFP